MLRILLVAAFATLAISSSAEAAVVADVAQDTLTIDGDAAADGITLRLAPGAPNTLMLDQASFDRSTFSRISIRSSGGADAIRIDESNGVFTDTETTTIETGAGADIVTGGRGVETIATGDDGDFVNSGGGADNVLLGAGDDTFVQNPGAGFDFLQAQGGNDSLRINGSGDAEEITVQTHLGRLLVNRDSGDVGMSAATVETLEVNASAGTDLIDIGDLTGSGVKRLDADLGLADGAPDAIAAHLTDATDVVELLPIGETPTLFGAPYELRVEGADRANDRMTVHGRGGNDVLWEGDDAFELIELTLDGGSGVDEIGGNAADLRGGDGDDSIVAGRKTETIEGGAGTDRVRVTGSSADDLFHVDASGARVRVWPNLTGPLEIVGTEMVTVRTLAGTDRIVTSDLTGTETTALVVEPGSADLKPDTVSVNGTAGANYLRAVSGGTTQTIVGQGAAIMINATEPTDRLQINGGSGEDTIDAAQVEANRVQLSIDGGPDTDSIVGSAGADVITGGTGNDVAFMGAGLDTFNHFKHDGNDVVDGGTGTDSLHMDGSGAPEQFDVAPAGSRTRVNNDGAVADLGGVERLDIVPGRGFDTMRVRDLSGTATNLVAWDLAPFRGTNASDNANDVLFVDGTFGNDAIFVTATGAQARVTGLPAAVTVTRPDKADLLTIDTRPGPDSVAVAPAVHDLLTFSSF